MIRQLKIFVLFALVIATAAGAVQGKAEAAAPATLKYGSTGPDVPDLQYRLQLLGFFKPAVTTTFGVSTRTAVRQFQLNHGLPVDGVVGPRTWNKLKKVSVSKPELAKLARVIYGEARGESYTGQVAVGAVVMNRLQSSQFPNTLAGVIFEPWAFTAINDGQYWLIPDATAFKAAKDAVKGWDPSGNALFYYNPDTASSDWIRSRKIIKKIGNHVFAY
ncbi:spore cortex-lytic enzyme [Paenibacillus mendelii]|uniref:Spore cortex-lytic enzyme n=1 Tax=Paenibacillus mendelii TaxID=206163 RepID=A0ABV6JGJ4_9BACL|nr:spore cortex-lytic enzyme [Paenibacillus mendelii]MCQ6557706.1 spore cortex-lytic enzyme [Paenibacillus mendelii]